MLSCSRKGVIKIKQEGIPMGALKTIVGSAAIAALVTLPASSASAGWHRHHEGCFILALPFCVAGAVVGAAATVATAPFVVAGGVLSPRPGYYREPGPYQYYRPYYYYPPPAAYYRPPAYYGPPPSYGGYEGPPPGY